MKVKKTGLAIVLVVFMTATSFAMSSAHAVQNDRNSEDRGDRCGGRSSCIIPFNQHFRGASYAEWQARWYRWLAAIPTPANPLFDDTGARCHTGQSGRVWFSAPVSHNGTTDRTCVLPEGTALFVLVELSECSTLEDPPSFGRNEAELRACAATLFKDAYATAMNTLRIDGRPVKDLDRFRTQTPLFSVTYPADNPFGAKPGTGKAISDGLLVMIRPLPEGRHRIELHIDTASGPAAGTVDDNYTIIINGHDHQNGARH